jgi:hypothetical protein
VFNDKEVSTKAHSLINFPLEMHNEKLIVTREESLALLGDRIMLAGKTF